MIAKDRCTWWRSSSIRLRPCTLIGKFLPGEGRPHDFLSSGYLSRVIMWGHFQGRSARVTRSKRSRQVAYGRVHRAYRKSDRACCECDLFCLLLSLTASCIDAHSRPVFCYYLYAFNNAQYVHKYHQSITQLSSQSTNPADYLNWDWSYIDEA